MASRIVHRALAAPLITGPLARIFCVAGKPGKRDINASSESNFGTHDHRIEEVTELLRLVESASKNDILVVATTNRIEALDPAILRKGRFDHSIEVAYPTADEVCTALNAMLNDRPHRDIQNLDQLLDRLAGRPMSDAAWVVNEAARLAARAKKDAIDEIDLFMALKRLKA